MSTPTENNLSDLFEEFLLHIGENPARDGLRETPARVARMWKELLWGYDPKRKPVVKVFDNDANYSQMIFVNGCFYSCCEHHLLPFFGQYFFAYIPDKKIIGLSKIARVVDFHSARLQVQERLTNDIINELENALIPRGIALLLKARHLCQEMRGARKIGSEMITSELRELFRERESTRIEFLQMIREVRS